MTINILWTIDMDTFDGIKTVIAVVETGSFTSASLRLNMSKALVSKYIGEVEKALNVRLFNRTTRQISLTEAGRQYYNQALQLQDQYQQMLDNVIGEQANPRGLLKISAPVSFGEQVLSPVIPQFIERYPELNIELKLNNRAIDMVEEGIDARIRIGGVDDSNMIARHIANYPLIMCASKEYLAKHPPLTKPEDLEQHHCVIDANFRIGRQWPVICAEKQIHTVNVPSKISANSPKAVTELVKASAGIGLIPSFVVKNDLQSGALLQILPDCHSLEFGLFVIYPHRKFVPRKLKCFIDFMFEQFGS